jgi:hypothetical protein
MLWTGDSLINMKCCAPTCPRSTHSWIEEENRDVEAAWFQGGMEAVLGTSCLQEEGPERRRSGQAVCKGVTGGSKV